MGLRMEQSQAQTQVLAPHLRQSLKILQASALDLRTVIQEELQINPTLEEIPPESLSLDNSFKDYDSCSSATKINPNNASKKHAFLMGNLTSDVSLQDHLLKQLGCLELPDKMYQIVAFIIGCLNDKGFLDLSIEDIILQTGTNHKTIKEAINIVQEFDPIGIGCKNVAESLLLQLKYHHKKSSLASQILTHCYPLLLRNKIIDIARALSVSTEAIQNAIQQDIAPLDPTPGRRFQTTPSQGIIPDVRIHKNTLNEWIVELNNQYIPKIQIGSLYKNLLTQNIKTEDRNYLRLKMRSGRFLINSILQRQKTIEQIAYALLNRQFDFFEQGPQYLKPLTLQILAEDLQIHETTVSRATANKYVDTPFGIFSFKYFFTKGLNSYSGECISNSIVKQQIQKIIEAEDKRKPLSDQKIVAILTENNVQIARRTIAKYRELLGIPAASLRRKYD